MKLTNSTSDFPIRATDQRSTLSIAPLRIASISATSPGRRSRPFRAASGRSVKTPLDRPSTFDGDRTEPLDLILSWKAGSLVMTEHKWQHG